MLRLAATDLDGTLLRSDRSIAPRTLEALRAARLRGMRHLIVTGRPASGCGQVFDALGYRGIAVCGQGAQLYDVTARRVLSTVALDRDLARTLVARLLAELAELGVPGELSLAVNTSGPEGEFVRTPAFPVRDTLSPVRTCRPRDLWRRPVDRVFLRHPVLLDDDLAALAARVCGPLAAVTHSDRGLVEILPAGTDKGTGLALAAERYGVDLADVIAFGDMPNDIPLLSRAGHGVAMGNCHPDLKAVADEVAPHHDDDGVARVLEGLTRTSGQASSDPLNRPVPPDAPERTAPCASTC
ncbi:HAD family hydrolase [Streptomyces sp. NBC_01006]|uniref:HAD family hydrolase n=1 Tax=Streptomyces sp. NBC_01006 TaxID=2903716 RepID=UPI00386B3F5D|nr:HAD family hydrolase [Streptomyces sp. NBC_01006]